MADQNIRVPNLPMGEIVNEDRTASPDELTFRQRLISSLQDNFGDEGLVAPTQTAADIVKIQNNKAINPITGQVSSTDFTCQYGTILYNSTANSIMIAINDGSGAPIFKTVTLT